MVPAMIPITKAVFSAASDEIRSRFLPSPDGRDVDLGGGRGGSSGYSVLVVVDIVVTDVIFVLPVATEVVELLPLELPSEDVESGSSEVLESVCELVPRPPSSGVVPPVVVDPANMENLFYSS